MEIYLLTATEISRTNEIDVNTLAFKECDDAVAEMKCKILDDLHNFNEYREMDIYEQEEFVERLLSGSSETLNGGYDIIYITVQRKASSSHHIVRNDIEFTCCATNSRTI